MELWRSGDQIWYVGKVGTWRVDALVTRFGALEKVETWEVGALEICRVGEMVMCNIVALASRFGGLERWCSISCQH